MSERHSQVTKMGIHSLTQKSHSSIFDGANQSKRLPKKWFDFIVIFHYLFNDEERRKKILQIYKDIFTNSLNDSGYTLLNIQENNLLIPYNVRRVDDCQQELCSTTICRSTGLKISLL